ncbi:LysR family transcriptional regulator [Pseudooceanicola sp. MF1-13]|uniref:LysR family transcriptional regulator n=1 Tax=Pseudooceanicola sp. MF1-13 TaxID=3379095 RepID=UPI0038913800
MANPRLNLDVAALRTLRAVYASASFSRAAESLGVAQPTVSYNIARLREVFQDPLFVRQGAQMVPTDRCIEIAEEVSELADRFEALVAPQQFEPAVANTQVVISCNYYERIVIIPTLVRMLRREAPGIRIRIIPSTVYGQEQLSRGESDILIGPIAVENENFFRRSLIRETYYCIMDPDNPLATSMTLDAYVAAPQVIVNYGGSFRSRFLVNMEAMGLSPNTAMEIPSPSELPDLLRGTDLIATVPSRVVQHFGESVASVPLPLEAEINITMSWTPRTHRSAPHSWIRDRIAQVASGLG